MVTRSQYTEVLERVAGVPAGSVPLARRLRVLEEAFAAQESEYLVACMRLLVSLHLQQNESFYEPFCLSDTAASVKDYCSRVRIAFTYFLIFSLCISRQRVRKTLKEYGVDALRDQ